MAGSSSSCPWGLPIGSAGLRGGAPLLARADLAGSAGSDGHAQPLLRWGFAPLLRDCPAVVSLLSVICEWVCWVAQALIQGNSHFFWILA